MPKYKLLSPHYINDQLLVAGTIVGGEEHPLPQGWLPTPECEGLDDEAKKLCKKWENWVPDLGTPFVPGPETPIQPAQGPKPGALIN